MKGRKSIVRRAVAVIVQGTHGFTARYHRSSWKEPHVARPMFRTFDDALGWAMRMFQLLHDPEITITAGSDLPGYKEGQIICYKKGDAK